YRIFGYGIFSNFASGRSNLTAAPQIIVAAVDEFQITAVSNHEQVSHPVNPRRPQPLGWFAEQTLNWPRSALGQKRTSIPPVQVQIPIGSIESSLPDVSTARKIGNAKLGC